MRFPWNRSERAKTFDVSAHFSAELASKEQKKLILSYLINQREESALPRMPLEEIERVQQTVNVVSKIVAERTTHAFEEAKLFYNRNPGQPPKLMIQKLDPKRAGYYDAGENVIQISLVDVVNFVRQMMKDQQYGPEQVNALVQLLLTIYEEVAHYFQYLDKKNRKSFELPSWWNDISEEEQLEIYDKDPLERDAKDFAVRNVLSFLLAKENELLSQNDAVAKAQVFHITQQIEQFRKAL